MLGWAATPDDHFVDENPTWEVPDPDSSGEEFEDFVYEASGRWVCIVTSRRPRVYLDPGGSLAAVYRRAGGAVASTTTLLQVDPSARLDRPPVEANHSYVFGETSDPTIARLLPSHALDLVTWEPERHWPREEIVPQSDAAAGIQQISDSLTGLMRSLARRAPLVLPLTAGRDSRMLLASTRTILDRCEFVTFAYTDHRVGDTLFGRAVARRFGLRHKVLALTEPSAEARAEYLHAVGYDASDGKSRDFLTAATSFPEDRGWLTGFAGEVGRTRFWGNPDDVVTPHFLLSRLRADPSPERLEAAARWLGSLPGSGHGFVMDMLYIDQRLGNWVSPQLYGTAQFAFNIYPLNQRRIFEAMLRLPADMRREGRMSHEVVNVGWPELTGYPHGRGPGLAGRWGQVRSVPYRLVNRIRYKREQARIRRSAE